MQVLTARFKQLAGVRVVVASALVLAVLSIAIVPVFAAKPPVSKTIGASITPSTVASGSSTAYQVTLTNTTPGNSNPNSFTIAVPAGWNVTDASYVSGTNINANRSVTFNAATDVVSVTGLDPLKSTGGQNVVVSVTADAPTTDGCAGTSGLWTIVGFTGSGTSGDTFSRNTDNGLVTTTVTSGCAIGIVAPDSAIVGGSFSVTAQALSGGALVSSYSGNFALALTGECSTTDTSPKAADGGQATFTIDADTVGSCDATVTGTGLSGDASATVAIFSDGINCSPDSDSDTNAGTTVFFERTDNGPTGLPGDCQEVPYTLTVENASTIVLLKDEAIVDEQLATFRLTISWSVNAGAYGEFNSSEFDPDGIDGNGDEYIPANCVVVGGVAQYPNPEATQHWCFAGVTIAPAGILFTATETFLGAGDPTIRFR